VVVRDSALNSSFASIISPSSLDDNLNHISPFNMNQGITDLTYIDENEVRLNVTTGWQSLEILSEVGVAYTYRGFTPALIVFIIEYGAKYLSLYFFDIFNISSFSLN
ncbi:MAG: hypothetical protein RIT11_1108, partial [Pseudomonadota bacterium]